MSLEVGVNSYVDLSYADAYFVTRYGVSETWAALTDTDKIAALVTAMPPLESYCSWANDKTDPDQDLQHPRGEEAEVHAFIKNAQCELALAVVRAKDVLQTNSPAIKRLKADTVEIEYNLSSFVTNSLYNTAVTGFLDPFCHAGGSNRVIRT